MFDRVPWPRPDILHRARKPVFGGAAYDDRIARLRLRQAYGRLIRRADDRGVFVILDRALPSRLLTAFPEGVPIARVPLVEAAEATARFLAGCNLTETGPLFGLCAGRATDRHQNQRSRRCSTPTAR